MLSKRIFVVLASLLWLTGCTWFASRPHGPAGGKEQIIETVLAAATDEHPRESEGDVIVLKDGTLLAAWSDFVGGRGDAATADISAATSHDGGRTWNTPFVLQRNIGRQNVMSVSFLRLRSGEILFFFLLKNSAADLKVYVRRSKDEAKTWTEAAVVTGAPGYHIMNNARVVQLKSGRILCPISFCDDISQRKSHLSTFVYYSDDEGLSWKRSSGIVDCAKRGAMEPGLIELKNGDVLQIIRTELGQIWSSVSHDRGDAWSPARPFGIVAPEAPATIARVPKSGELLLVYNPSIAAGIRGMNARTPLVAAISRDEGKTWFEPKVIEGSADSTYAYTSITFQNGRVLLSYYVADKTNRRVSLKFKSIPIEWFGKNTKKPNSKHQITSKFQISKSCLAGSDGAITIVAHSFEGWCLGFI